jgi:hypothetical protein
MIRPAILGFLSSLCVAMAVNQADSRASDVKRSPDDLARRAETIKPSADELKWRQIPWVLDLGEGQRLARAERRPIFLWAAGDDPLERC